MFKDLLVAIDWMRSQELVKDIGLIALVDHVKQITRFFNFISFEHVFRKNKEIVDIISKEGLELI